MLDTFFCLKGFCGQPLAKLPVPLSSRFALIARQRNSPLSGFIQLKLAELRIFDFSDRTRTCISIWTLALTNVRHWNIEIVRHFFEALRLLATISLLDMWSELDC